MFVDIAKIQIKAGNGGDGAVAFHNDKSVASAGPAGRQVRPRLPTAVPAHAAYCSHSVSPLHRRH